MDRRRRVPLADVLDRHPPDGRRAHGTGIEPGEDLLVGARRAAARDGAAAAGVTRRARRRPRRRVDEGLAVRALGPDLRGHERDPAQRRGRARARAPAAVSAWDTPSRESSLRLAYACAPSASWRA